MLRTILFDLDGTLLDTLPDITHHVNEMLSAFSYPTVDEAFTRHCVGDGAKKLIERVLPAGETDSLERCYEYFRTRFAASKNERTRLFEGEMAVLHALKDAGYTLGIVTNKPQDATERVVNAFFPAGLFSFVGGDTGNFPCKPDPALARYAALSLRCAPCDCAFVGDGETDVQVALRAGMQGVAVLWGYRTREELSAAGATRFAGSFSQLKKILENFA